MEFSLFHRTRGKSFRLFCRKFKFSHPRIRRAQMLFKPMKYYTFWGVLGAMGPLFEKSAFSLKLFKNVEKVKNHEKLNFPVKK